MMLLKTVVGGAFRSFITNRSLQFSHKTVKNTSIGNNGDKKLKSTLKIPHCKTLYYKYTLCIKKNICGILLKINYWIIIADLLKAHYATLLWAH